MKKLIAIAVVAFIACLGPFGAIASADTGIFATVTGTVSLIEGNDFVLTDAEGTAYSICGGPSWYQALTLVDGATVTVYGQVEEGTSPTEIDAYTITPEGGETTTIREGEGPPPWAGGPNKGNRQEPVEDNCGDAPCND